MSFKENLKSDLSYQGILVKELATKTGISRRTLDNYLREKSSLPPVDVAVKIADALNVSVEFLVTGKEKNESIQDNQFKISDPTYAKLPPKKKHIIDETIQALIKTLADTDL